jgi:predicted amidohydrolase
VKAGIKTIKKGKMDISLVQIDISWQNKEQNFSMVDSLLSTSETPAGSLIILPEMFATGFSMDVALNAEDSDGTTMHFLGRTAKKYNSYVIAGLTEKSDTDMGLNVCYLIDPDGNPAGRYVKNYPFSLGEEDKFFLAGDKSAVWNIPDAGVSPAICYDLRFPELFREAADSGAEVFVVIANWPSKRIDHWKNLLIARAVENQCWVIGVNRTGSDPFHHYNGRSMIVDPHGRVCADMGDQHGQMNFKIDIEVCREWRLKFPALKDRKKRPD